MSFGFFLLTYQRWLEHGLGAPESLVAQRYYLSVWKFVRLLKARRVLGQGYIPVEIQCHETDLLFQVANDLPLRGRGEAVTPLGEQFHQIVGEISSCQVHSKNGVRKSIT